jgi:D-tyrosyl-tRNA(Tyr) deacylase
MLVRQDLSDDRRSRTRTGRMRAVVQRVERAEVRVDGQVVGEIGVGLLVLLGVTHTDSVPDAARLAAKVHTLRILRDERSVADSPDAGVLVISQFTLYAETLKGRRPSWSAAAPGSVAEPLVAAFCALLRELGATVETGLFGADMRVELVNDGPVTLLLES